MRNADRGEAERLDGRELHVGIVQARFNAGITDRIVAACRAELAVLGVAPAATTLLQVPGALEIGIALAALAETDEFDALIAVGCVIRGETYHFELVANESGAAVTRVSLDHSVPVANVILTCENEAQAAERADDNGRDAARVAVEMANLLDDWS